MQGPDYPKERHPPGWDPFISPTLKSLLRQEFNSGKVVYERMFFGSVPHLRRQTYYLTEMINISKILANQKRLEPGYDGLRLKYNSSLYEENNPSPAKRTITGGATTTANKNSESNQEASFHPLPAFHQSDLDIPSENILHFESRFECGNLCIASIVDQTEYDLYMQNDTNSGGNTQWFFFRVTNTKDKANIKFNIKNYSKQDSLYNKGMKILIYSQKGYDTKKVGWFYGGTDIKYYPNGIRKVYIL